MTSDTDQEDEPNSAWTRLYASSIRVSNILGKLAVTRRGEAAAVAYRLGLVEPAREPV